MKRNFITGIAILLPAALTLIVVIWLIDLLTDPFLGIAKLILVKLTPSQGIFSFLSNQHMILFLSRILTLLCLAMITIFIGFLAHLFFLKPIFDWGNAFIHRIPLINRVYKAVQDGLHALFNLQNYTHKQIVMVPYPNTQTYCIGFMLNDSHHPESDSLFSDKVSVFVVGSPNPTMGFMLIYPKKDVIPLDMTIEEAFRYIFSCGTLKHEYKPCLQSKS